MRMISIAVAFCFALTPVAQAATTPTQTTGQVTSGSPDLMPSDVKVSASAIKPGQSVTVRWVMANKGDGRAAASVTGLRLRPAGRSDNACDFTLIREIPTPSIEAGRSIPMQYPLTVPDDVPAGKYAFLVIADNSTASTLGQKDSSNDYALSGEVTSACQSFRPSDRPLVTALQFVSDAGFADPGYARTELKEHLGTDFQAACGACVYAVRDGKVVENTIADDPMRAVVIIEHADKSKAIYGHIKSSVGNGNAVTRGTLLGTVKDTDKVFNFASHLHLGEWTKPSDILLQDKEKYDKECVHTDKGLWGWGRAPLGTTREQMLKCGWVDPAARYRTEAQTNTASRITAPTGNPTAKDDIRHIDFLNFSYRPTLCHSEYAKEGIGKVMQIRNGKFANGKIDYGVVDNKVIYGELTGDNGHEAVVHTNCWLKGANFGLSEIQIFTLQDGQALLLANINDNDRQRDYRRYYPGGNLWFGLTGVGSAVKIIGGNLIIEQLADGPHCCPESVVTLTYHWNGKQFVLSKPPQKKPFTN